MCDDLSMAMIFQLRRVAFLWWWWCDNKRSEMRAAGHNSAFDIDIVCVLLNSRIWRY